MTIWLVNTYDAAGERTLKLTGNYEEMNINGQYNINAYNLNNYTLYTSPYMVVDPKGYTKHYYIESDRFVSKIGGGMANINYRLDDHVYGMDINDWSHYEHKSDQLFGHMMHRHFDFIQVNDDVIEDLVFKNIGELQDYYEQEKFIFFYHKDHLGSSTQISDRDARIIHHIEYMPTGEQFSEQRDWWSTPYKFNGKELDAETGLYYYGARYYNPALSIWTSVDPMSDKYPSMSSYMYCAGNPVILVDPDGREITDYRNLNGTLFHVEDGSNDVKIVLTENNSQAEIQKAISKGEVVDMPCKSVLTTFDNIYTKTDEKNTEHYAAGDDFGNMSDIFEGQDGVVDAKTIQKARINMLEKGGEGTTWDVHSHNKSFDKFGKISDVGLPNASENDKQTPNKFGVILGYDYTRLNFNTYGGDRETTRRIGFYNSKGQIGSSNGYNYEKFSNVVRSYGY